MHIAFDFHYIHTNGLFIRLLNRIRERSSLPLNLYSVGHHYRIEASGEQHELEALAQEVSRLIPQSLFLRETSLQEIDGIHPFDPLPQETVPYEIPYCLECQHHIHDTLNPFQACDVCGFESLAYTLDDFTADSPNSSDELFLGLADLLIQEGSLTLATYNGMRHFSLLSAQEAEGVGILVCNPEDISDFLMITQGELDALMMVEKPSVRLKPKLKFKAHNDLRKPLYPVFFPDDKITLALTCALSRKGIFAIFSDQVPSLRVASALGHHALIDTGRDMVPWHSPMVLAQPSSCTVGNIRAYGDVNGIRLTSLDPSRTLPSVEFVMNREQISPATIVFQPAHAALRSVALEQDLQTQSLCGIYLSRCYASGICAYSPKIGYLPMADFSAHTISEPHDMLLSIARMDEAGQRLVENFTTAFPQLYEQIQHARFEAMRPVSVITKLWAMAALFIGIDDGHDVQEACEMLEAYALEFTGKSGPRIDYKVLKSDNGYDIDPRLAIRSAMSFKLAGVDAYLLSFGFIDSLADFIAQQAELADSHIGIRGVTLSGSLFENRQLLMRTYNAISANYPLFRNERLSMDGMNIALGAVTLGSESK